MYQTIYTAPNDYLMHHGVKGQKWGIRRFQNADGTLTAEGKARYDSAYGKGIGFRNANKEVKKMHKELINEFKERNPYATKSELREYKRQSAKDINNMSRRYVAENAQALKKRNATSAGAAFLAGAASELAGIGLRLSSDTPVAQYAGLAFQAAGVGAQYGSVVSGLANHISISRAEKELARERVNKLLEKSGV